MNKSEKLQQLCDRATRENQWDYLIEYRPFVGWYAVSLESRYFYDDGEWLGRNFEEAKKGLLSLLA